MGCRELAAYRRLPHAAASADGAELVLSNGERVLDLYGGHCVNTLGAGDPLVAETLRRHGRINTLGAEHCGLNAIVSVRDCN